MLLYMFFGVKEYLFPMLATKLFHLFAMNKFRNHILMIEAITKLQKLFMPSFCSVNTHNWQYSAVNTFVALWVMN